MSSKKKAYILVLPSLFTTGNLFCGFYSILQSIKGDFEYSIYAIVLAGIFDVLDGQVARLTKSQSNFGVEYDSISDVVSFGVAPALLVYFYGLGDFFGRLGFSAAFFFTACGALRLARFNSQVSPEPKSYFIGLPIPAAAGLVGCFVLLHIRENFFGMPYLLLGLTFFSSFLMVSQIRFRAFKNFNFKSKRSFFFLVFFIGVLAIFFVYPEFVLFVGFFSYVLGSFFRDSFNFLFKKK